MTRSPEIEGISDVRRAFCQVARKSMHPYKMDTSAIEWWTIYTSS